MNRFLPLAILILTMTACTWQEAPPAATGAQPTAVAVQVETVSASEIADIYRASGTVQARYSAAIAARIAADILEIRVQAGDRVRRGQVLVVLDGRDLEANLRRAEAARTEVESSMQESGDAIRAAAANLELARATHKRFEELLRKMSVSQQEFEESEARLKSAEAAHEMAVAKRGQVEARRSQVKADIAAARVALDHATLAAPFDGLITERKSDPGSLATPGTSLLILEREGNLRLEVSIDESRLSLARTGERVPVEIDAVNRNVEGRVAEIVPSVDPATRTFTAKIDLPAIPGLRAGLFGRALFVAGKRKTLLAPATSILEHGQIRSVYVVEGETARLRLVTAGEGRDNSREILSGLKDGEKVIVAPSPLVADGGRVAMEEAAK